MPLNNVLTPTSFHLRNFNNYVTLDIDASLKGNLTLIGENAAGKTTLANCFFPLLVDGSIATPSFNPAKGTDKLDQVTTPHSSTRDTRTFDSMLLGWGDGAMKARTGYSYMCLRSQLRQVILGIGAYRAIGESRTPTWWFIMINDHPEVDLQVITTDDQGHSLTKDEFIAANHQLGEQLHLFTRGTSYREFAAEKVYGFTDTKNLGQLATTYRLLASPILTAGNARFAPIQAALKNAQEGIDTQIIDKVAGTQREVNRIKGVSNRLGEAQKRLSKLKTEIFWRNLNRLKELVFTPYGRLHQDHEKVTKRQENAQRNLGEYQRQLAILQPEIARLEGEVAQLQRQVAEQSVIKEHRQSVVRQITTLSQQLARFQELQRQLSKQEADFTALKAEQTTADQQLQQLEQEAIRPLRTQIESHTEGLSDLIQAIAESDLTVYQQHFKRYIRDYQHYLEQHLQLVQRQEQLSTDVKLVGEMSAQMQGHIEQRTQGALMGRVRDGLLQDNDAVHKNGATKMNQQFKPLEDQRQTLLRNHADLAILLKHPDLWQKLTQQSQQFSQLIKKREQQLQANKELSYQVASSQEKLAGIQEQLQLPGLVDFIPAQANQELTRLQTKLATLVVDQQLPEKLQAAQGERAKFLAQQTTLQTNSASETTIIATTKQQLADLQKKLQNVSQQAKANLKILKPYFPESVELPEITAAIEFAHKNRSEIRNHPFAELTDRIGRLIHNNNEAGIDVNALDSVFEERGRLEIASAMRQQRSKAVADLTVVAFDIEQAQTILENDVQHVDQALQQTTQGNDIAQAAYVEAAASQIADQYDLIAGYNEILAHGVREEQGIQLKVELIPVTVSQEVIDEVRHVQDQDRPLLLAEVQKRLTKLASNLAIVNDDEQFMAEAYRLLDIRQWSEFRILIHRRQSKPNEFELVDDKFVQSGGSGAEKAQAMVLPLLLVPKMILHRSQANDAPHLVMFDEFADKLDPETAKSFAKTIDHFGFNFIATMPGGAQNKILADGVANVAYDVIAPKYVADSKFHPNNVRPALIWQQRAKS